jgi:DNA-binding winged helix-turn-helix (wHTH) protein
MEQQVFDVLAYLVAHNDRLVPKRVARKVWGDRFVGDAALNSRVMAVRRAIGDSGKEQRLIKTVHGRGYRFVAPVAINPETPERSIEPITTNLSAPTPAVPERREQEIRFCSAPDGVRLAYAVVGKGAPLVKAPNWLSHLGSVASPSEGTGWRSCPATICLSGTTSEATASPTGTWLTSRGTPG